VSEATVRSLPKINGFQLARPALLPLFIYLAVLLAVSLFFVWSRLTVVNLEYDISRLGVELREVEQEQKRLRLESAHLRSPVRIEKVAVSELGLRMPSLEQIILVD